MSPIGTRPHAAVLAGLWLTIAILLSGESVASELATVKQIPSLMESFRVDGLAVSAVSRDHILVARGFGEMSNGDPYTSSSSCGLYSATKVLASLTYANLARAGRLDLDAPLDDLLEDAPADWSDIPFYRLLNHTSGITMVVNKPAFGDLLSDPNASNETIYRLVKGAPLDYQPGEFSRYRQSGYAVGEWILSQRLGEGFDVLIKRYVTDPAGMTKTTHPALSDESQPRLILSAGGYQTTADDMARLFLGINSATVIGAGYWKMLLLDERHAFGNYSLGNIIDRRNGVLTLGHRGGGARANIRYAPDQKIGVMVCTDDTQNNELTITLARMLIEEIYTGKTPKTPLLVALADYETATGAEVVANYRYAARQGERFDLSESEVLLNTIGYALTERDDMSDAIAVFSLNVELFPSSPNTHDSLGEALLASGDVAGALAQYRKVLELDPGNVHATAMIEKIQATPAGAEGAH
ncbi:MAG: serine hydrolase [Pseudomonadota bacterium]